MNSPRSRAGALVVPLLLALVLLAGCGRLRHDASPTPSVVAPTTTALAASDSTTTTAAGSSAESKTLDSIEQQLSTVNSQLSTVGGDLSTADRAINSQEGDPSK
jgi:TolA-binding protein